MSRNVRIVSLLLVLSVLTLPLHAASPNVVISQVYGGGGNSGATLKNHYIELFNRGAATVSLAGWTVQYASSTGTTWNSTPLSGSIAPGHYYLVQEAQGSGGTQNLPTPDASGGIALSATTGKIALVSSMTLLAGACPSGSVVDLVGYGSANCSEGTTAPALTNTTALFRSGGGCLDTDSNSADFSTGSPNPRNSSSAGYSCGGTPSPTNPSILISASPSYIAPGDSVLLVVTVNPGANPASTGITVTGNLNEIGGPYAQRFYDDGTNGDATAGDNKFSFRTTVSGTTLSGSKTITVTVIDAQSRSAATSIQLTVATPATTTDSDQLVFPHIADGGGYKTVLLLTNGTETNTTATVYFFSDSAEPLTVMVGSTTAASFVIPIPARGSAKLTTSGVSAGVSVGWAKVTTSPSVGLNGNAIFQLFNGDNLFSEASVSAAPSTNVAEFYADEEDGFNTGFAMANPGSSAANGALTLRTASGAIVATSSFSIPPKYHTAIFLWQIISGAPSGRAEINLTSGTLSVTALRYHSSAVFSTVSVGQPGGRAITALFSPKGGVRERIISEVNKASSSLDIAIYCFTADEIRDALIAAKNRGVAIRIIADMSQADGQGSEIALLQSLGFNLKLMSGPSGGMMHDKYMIIDGKSLLTGSYNWSANAEDNNYENAIFLRDQSAIQGYVLDFERMWAR